MKTMIKRRFVTSQLKSGVLLTKNNQQTLQRLIHNDFNFFLDLSRKEGPHQALDQLVKVDSEIDRSSREGRKLYNIKNEMINKIIYENRVIAE